jgi:SAM-dependent methyltransferase
MLEIGCGSGRLVPYLAPHFRSYTGFDIAPTMLDVARRRAAAIANARFFESDGLSVPAGAQDRLYDFGLAAAVLIHCSKEVCERLAESAFRQIRPGGRLRLEMYADYNDPEGIIPGSALGMPDQGVIPERAEQIERSVTSRQQEHIEGTQYEGHRFRYAEAREWLDRLGEARLYRVSPLHIYADVVRRV